MDKKPIQGIETYKFFFVFKTRNPLHRHFHPCCKFLYLRPLFPSSLSAEAQGRKRMVKPVFSVIYELHFSCISFGLTKGAPCQYS